MAENQEVRYPGRTDKLITWLIENQDELDDIRTLELRVHFFENRAKIRPTPLIDLDDGITNQ